MQSTRGNRGGSPAKSSFSALDAGTPRTLRPSASTTPRDSPLPSSRGGDADRVRVYVRVRPRMDDDGSPNAVQLHPDGCSLTIQRENRATAKFEFDGVLPPSASQADVYSCAVAPIVADVLAGYNGTVMAYGQTGAGKTYTLSSMSQNSIGMIPRAAAELFAALARENAGQGESPEAVSHRFASPPLASRQVTQQSDSSASRSGSEEGSSGAPRLQEAEYLGRFPPRIPASRPGEVEHTVLLSYIQIYQEAVQDLLCPESENLSIRESDAGVFVWGAQQREVSSLEQCLALVRAGDANRATAFTALNASSSRSHAVVMFTVISRRALGEPQGPPAASDLLGGEGGELARVRVGKLFLVDLAGSERLKKSQSVGIRATEARAINLSLTVLGKCIAARADRASTHVPFRDSKLTRLLQDSLGGNARTALLVAAAPEAAHGEETGQSLLFGARAMRVLTRARVNERLDCGAGALLAGAGGAKWTLLERSLLERESEVDALQAAVREEQRRACEVAEALAAEAAAAERRAAEELAARDAALAAEQEGRAQLEERLAGARAAAVAACARADAAAAEAAGVAERARRALEEEGAEARRGVDRARDEARREVERAEEEARRSEERAERAAEEAVERINRAGEEAQERVDKAEKEAQERVDRAEKEAQERVDRAEKEAQERVDRAEKEARERVDHAIKEAQERADSAIKEARESADSAIKEAQEKADSAIKEAQERAEEKVASLSEQMAALKREADARLAAKEAEAADLAERAEQESLQRAARAQREAEERAEAERSEAESRLQQARSEAAEAAEAAAQRVAEVEALLAQARAEVEAGVERHAADVARLGEEAQARAAQELEAERARLGREREEAEARLGAQAAGLEEELAQARVETKETRKSLEEQLAQARADAREARESLEEQLAQARADAREARESLEEQRAGSRELQAMLQQRHAQEVRELEARLGEAREGREAIGAELEVERARAADLGADLRSTRAAKEALAGHLAAAEADRAALRAELSRAAARLASERARGERYKARALSLETSRAKLAKSFLEHKRLADAARAIQRAWRAYRLRVLRAEGRRGERALRSARCALGDLAEEKAALARARDAERARVGEALLGEALRTLQQGVQAAVAAFVLPARDLRSVARFQQKVALARAGSGMATPREEVSNGELSAAPLPAPSASFLGAQLPASARGEAQVPASARSEARVLSSARGEAPGSSALARPSPREGLIAALPPAGAAPLAASLAHWRAESDSEDAPQAKSRLSGFADRLKSAAAPARLRDGGGARA